MWFFYYWMNNLKDRKLYFLISFFSLTMENLRCLNPANIRLDEDVLKTFWTRSQHNILLSFKTSWGRLEDIIARRLKEDVLQIRLEDVLEEVLKTSWRRLWKRSCKHDLKTSWRRLGRWKIVTLKTSSRRLQDILKNKKCLLGTLL